MPIKTQCISCNKICYSPNKTEPRCRPCSILKRKNPLSKREYSRQWALIKKYGLDNLDFECLWYAFKGKCGICLSNLIFPEERKGQSRRVAVINHDHRTGKLRGLLCNSCNKGLGLFDDSIENIKRTLDWLSV